MLMTARLRKLALTAHVTSSVGWLGAVVAFLALAVSGLTSEDEQLVRASYIAMDVTGWAVIVPMGLASLPTGLIMSLGTEWGLIRHYWVVAKLFISVLATLLLLVHMEPVGHLARVVSEATLAQGELAGLRIQLAADAGAAFVALLIATALSVYKPRGLTGYGRRQLNRNGDAGLPVRRSISENAQGIAMVIIAIVVLLFLAFHLGGSRGGH